MVNALVNIFCVLTWYTMGLLEKTNLKFILKRPQRLPTTGEKKPAKQPV